MPVPITYLGFCALGGLTNPRLFTRTFRNIFGSYTTDYYFIR